MKRLHGIAGLSEARRLPRLGKIRLGIKLKSAKGTEYPADCRFPTSAGGIRAWRAGQRRQSAGVGRNAQGDT